MSTQNAKLNEGFSQVCVWPGTLMGDNTPEDFEKFMLENFNVRTQFLEVIFTYPDVENGKIVEETGERSDIFFAIHIEDIAKFAVPRLQYGIRWIEDVLSNANYRMNIYPERVFAYKTWDADTQED